MKAGYQTDAPIEIVNWTNEEGARFARAMLASGVFACVFSRDYAYARTDRDGKTFGEELARIGYRGEERAGARAFAAMFELHVSKARSSKTKPARSASSKACRACPGTRSR